MYNYFINKLYKMNTDLTFIYDKIEAIEPVSYSKNRNYIDGAVSKLSPYISRGVISTKEILNSLLQRGFNPNKIEKFIQELAWRDYWQQIWIEKQDLINSDLKRLTMLLKSFTILVIFTTMSACILQLLVAITLNHIGKLLLNGCTIIY